jgi:hypothetical protein
LDDVAFIAERRRVREALEALPGSEADSNLMARFQRLDDEFLRRARIAWSQ